MGVFSLELGIRKINTGFLLKPWWIIHGEAFAFIRPSNKAMARAKAEMKVFTCRKTLWLPRRCLWGSSMNESADGGLVLLW